MSFYEDLKKLASELDSAHKKVQSFGDSSDFEEFESYEAFIDSLEAMGVNALTAKMNSDAPYYWFPSRWSTNPWGKPYPKILAKALIASQAKESLTDITNIFYSGSSLSPEAIEVFKKDVLADPANVIKFMTTEYLPQGLEGLAKHDLSFVKSLLMLLNESELKAHIETVKTHMGSPADAQYLEAVGLTPIMDEVQESIPEMPS